MGKPVIATLIMQVGSLQFMEVKSSYMFGKSEYFWKFKDSAAFYGPFNNLADAGAHVDDLMRGGAPPPEPPQNNTPAEEGLTSDTVPSNLIPIDFINKRRF